jgi:general secretion pathway protein A
MPSGGRVLRHLPGGQDVQSPAASSSAGLFSLTYEPYYGLKEKAFSLSSDPKFLFRSPEHAPAFDELLNGIRRREGLITLTGEIGTGKTTLIRSVLQHLDRRTFSAFVPDPFVSREDLLKMLLVDFGVVSVADLKRGSLNGASRPDLSYPLYEFLDSLVPLQAFAVAIIDEAQNLPLALLEEIRILSDLEGREKLLQVVLVGQPELRAHLKLPEMRQVNQRISVRCELTPLAREGVADYINHRLRVAGEGPSRVEFSAAAIAAIYDASGGTPRLINMICDRALHRGFQARVDRIEPSFIWDATKDLGLETDRPAAPVGVPAPAVAALKPAAPTTSPPATAEATAPPAPAPVTRSAIRVAPPTRELLSDFAAESDLSAARVNAGIARGWFLVAAAALVAVLAAGSMMAYLRVRAIHEMAPLPLPSAPQPAAPFLPTVALPGDEHFTIQVASFQTMARAEQVIARLSNRGYRARALELDLGRRGRAVAVIVGSYRNAQDASIDLSELRTLHGFTDARLEPLLSAVTR